MIPIIFIIMFESLTSLNGRPPETMSAGSSSIRDLQVRCVMSNQWNKCYTDCTQKGGGGGGGGGDIELSFIFIYFLTRVLMNLLVLCANKKNHLNNSCCDRIHYCCKTASFPIQYIILCDDTTFVI